MGVWSGRWRRWDAVFLGLTLLTSAVHFVDNAFRLDLYPGPAWLTPAMVLGVWVVVLLLAGVAFWNGSRIALIAYAAIGFAGLTHFLAAGGGAMPGRCIVTIFAEAGASVLLIVYAVFRPDGHERELA